MSDGWHPDPFGRYAQRYHDGSNWTNHVSNVAGVTEQDPMGTLPSPPGSMPIAPPVAYAPVSTGPEKANGFIRFAALVIDGLLLNIPMTLLFSGAYDDMLVYETDFRGEIIVDSIEWNFPLEVFLLSLALGALYQIGMIGRFGRTVGKMAVGVTVVRASDGGAVGYGVATVRYLAWWLYAVPLAGFVMFIVSAVKTFTNPKGQTIHDNIAQTMVVKSSSLRSA